MLPIVSADDPAFANIGRRQLTVYVTHAFCDAVVTGTETDFNLRTNHPPNCHNVAALAIVFCRQ